MQSVGAIYLPMGLRRSRTSPPPTSAPLTVGGNLGREGPLIVSGRVYHTEIVNQRKQSRAARRAALLKKQQLQNRHRNWLNRLSPAIFT